MLSSEVFLTHERDMLENNSDDEGKIDEPAEKQQKKAWTQNMNKYEKQVLICKCCEYA